jgi:hypothetical protein
MLPVTACTWWNFSSVVASNLWLVFIIQDHENQGRDGAYLKYTLKWADRSESGFNEPRGGLGGNLSNFGYEIYGSEAVRGYATMSASGHGMSQSKSD